MPELRTGSAGNAQAFSSAPNASNVAAWTKVDIDFYFKISFQNYIYKAFAFKFLFIIKH
jgi:hypothetical protein